MPIYDQRATQLIEQLKAASDTEGDAIKALHSYLEGSDNDIELLKKLTYNMDATHNEKMRIYQ